MTDHLLRATTSLCAQCKRAVPAEIWRTGDRVVMRKACAEHGAAEVVVSPSAAWYEHVMSHAPTLTAPAAPRPVAQGCPFDCGPCAAHEQATQLPIVPITSACNLDCPICYTHNKNEGAFHLSEAQLAAILGHLRAADPERRIINLTGGEPTQHPQFERLIERCAEEGIVFVGPSPVALELFGDKVAAKALAKRCNVPVIEGTVGPTTLDEAKTFFASLGKGGVLLEGLAQRLDGDLGGLCAQSGPTVTVVATGRQTGLPHKATLATLQAGLLTINAVALQHHLAGRHKEQSAAVAHHQAADHAVECIALVALPEQRFAGRELQSQNPDYTKDTSNTTLNFHNGKLLSAWYNSGNVYGLDPLTLATLGEETFGGARDTTMNAHGKTDARTGEFINYGYADFQPWLTYYVIGADGKLKHKTRIDLPGPRLPHDTTITPRFTILHDFPLFHDVEVMKRHGHRVALFHRDLPSRFGVMPRYGTQEQVRWFEFEPGYVLHMVNAWEDGDWITMDGCFQPDPTIRRNPEEGPLGSMLAYLRYKGHLRRWRMNVVTGEKHEQQIDDLNVEFCLPDMELYGQKTRYSYHQLIPTDLQTRANVDTWLDWAGTDLYWGVRLVFMGLVVKQGHMADPAATGIGIKEATYRMKLLDGFLAANGPFLAGDAFTIADIPAGLVVNRWFGIEWVEGGFPGSNPKDAEYFRRLKSTTLKSAKVSAFGGTRKPNIRGRLLNQ